MKNLYVVLALFLSTEASAANVVDFGLKTIKPKGVEASVGVKAEHVIFRITANTLKERQITFAYGAEDKSFSVQLSYKRDKKGSAVAEAVFKFTF